MPEVCVFHHALLEHLIRTLCPCVAEDAITFLRKVRERVVPELVESKEAVVYVDIAIARYLLKKSSRKCKVCTLSLC
jgi:hypothetical protein